MSVLPQQTVSLATVYRGWDGFERNLVKIIVPLSSEQVAHPVASHHWSIGHAIQHIVTDRSWWFHVWLGTVARCFQYTNWDGEGQLVRSPAELVTGLETTWNAIEEALARWTIADLDDVAEPPASLSEEERALLAQPHDTRLSGTFMRTTITTAASSLAWSGHAWLAHSIRAAGSITALLGQLPYLWLVGRYTKPYDRPAWRRR